MQERLQKIIARAGIASRRHAEHLILSGQVRVNGKTIRELGSKADTGTDKIEVSGKQAVSDGSHVYAVIDGAFEGQGVRAVSQEKRTYEDTIF